MDASKNTRKTFVVLGLCVVGILFAVIFSSPFYIFAQNIAPPKIKNVIVEPVADDSVAISWETDESSGELINYGLNNDYGVFYTAFSEETVHHATLTNLEPSSTYHFRVTSIDDQGNQGVSGNYTFITTGFENIPNIEKVASDEQKALVGKTFSSLEGITDPEALAVIAEQVENVAQDILLPPQLIGPPRVAQITTNSAIVSWTTDRDSNSLVSFSSDADFAGSEDHYSFTQGEPGEFVKEHVVHLIGLDPNTQYHFRISSEDKLGLKGEGTDEVFKTRSLLPTVQSIDIVKIEETSVTIAWYTDGPASGVIDYTNLFSGEVRSEGSPELLSNHTIRLTDLTFGTTYSAVIRTGNGTGEETISDVFTFTTILDEFPPIISRVNNESTLYPGAETKIQTLVSWVTDEPALCRLFYREGLVATTEGTGLAKEIDFTTDHVQVVSEFLPATVYKFWVVCEDATGNSVRSEDFVLFTPQKEKSIIDIILENFEGTFGWVKNINK